MDPKAVAEAMAALLADLYGVYKKTVEDGAEYEVGDVAYLLGRAAGTATAVKLQCEREGKPKMRGAAE